MFLSSVPTALEGLVRCERGSIGARTCSSRLPRNPQGSAAHVCYYEKDDDGNTRKMVALKMRAQNIVAEEALA